MSTPSLPNYTIPPRAMVAAAKAERDRRKACHGTWHPCDPKACDTRQEA